MTALVLTAGMLLSLSIGEPGESATSLVAPLESPLPGAGGDSALYAQSCLMASGGLFLGVGGLALMISSIVGIDGDSEITSVLLATFLGIFASAGGWVMFGFGVQGMQVFGAGGDAPPDLLPVLADRKEPTPRSLLSWQWRL